MEIRTTGDLLLSHLRYHFPKKFVVAVKMNDGQLLKALLLTNEQLQLNEDQYLEALHFGYVLFVCDTEDKAQSIFEEFPKSICHCVLFGPVNFFDTNVNPADWQSDNKNFTEGTFLTEN